MSSAASCSSDQGALPTTTTFLPILDDLLSPDFRPVQYPPVITPLQTPTTQIPNGGGAAAKAPAAVIKSINEEAAAGKIQKWWKNSKRSVDLVDIGSERAKHSIRHRRTEDHIRALETEVTRLKSSLANERKLRSLQYEAIRSLWSQVQKLTINNPDLHPSVRNLDAMSQSLPNGLPDTMTTSAVVGQSHCSCTSQITSVAHKLEEEIAELRNLIVQSLASKEEDRMDSSTSSGSTKAHKRPDSLDLNGSGGKLPPQSAKPEELQGYANEMAKFVVERGISDKLDGSGGGDEANN